MTQRKRNLLVNEMVGNRDRYIRLVCDYLHVLPLAIMSRRRDSRTAMAQISQIMANDERFGGVVTDEELKDESIWKYAINRNKNEIKMYQGTFGIDHFLSFHTPEQRDLFLNENKDLVKDYLMID